MRINLVICTYNPRRDYLERTIESLKEQDLPKSEWDLLIVDNNSSPALSEWLDLSWHPSARIVTESQQGLTPARLRAIQENSGELMVFSDDDNVLSSDYLSVALHLFSHNELLGCAGGSIIPEFEVEPPKGSERYLMSLALCHIDQMEVSNVHEINAKPFGAGMVVRQEVATAFRTSVMSDANRYSLGRVGSSLGGCEDIELGFTACDVGFYCGVFPQLKLTHLISEKRLTWAYFRKIRRGSSESYVKLCRVRALPVMSKLGMLKKLFMMSLDLLRGRLSLQGFRIELAMLAGTIRGLRAPLA